MKKILPIITIIILMCNIKLVAQVIQFDKNYSLATWTQPTCVLQLADTSYLSFGLDNYEIPVFLYEDRSALAVKFNQYGDTLKKWEYYGDDSLFFSQYGFIGEDRFTYACRTNDSNFLAVGNTQVYNPNSQYDHDVFLVKFDSNLDTLWTKIISIPGDTSALPNFIIKTHDNNYMIGGWLSEPIFGHWSSFLMKVDANGNEMWHQNYPTSNTNWIWAIAEADNGDIVCSGTEVVFNLGNPIVYKVDSNGNNQQFLQTFSSLGADFGGQVKNTNDGNFIAAMGYCPADIFGTPFYRKIVKFDLQGNIIFATTYQATYSGGCLAVIQAKDSGYIEVGSTKDLWIGGTQNGFMGKLGPTGVVLWSRQFFQGLNSLFWDVQQCSDGGYIMCGETYCCNNTSGNGYTSGFWLVKTDSLGLLITGINDAPNFSAVKFGLPYPNPSTTDFTITAFVPSYSNSAIKGKSGAYILLFDMQGKQLQELPLTIGLNTVNVNVSTYPSGNYLCVLVIDGYNVASKKVVVGK